MDFHFFEDEHVLAGAQRGAYREGEAVASVRNRFLSGGDVEKVGYQIRSVPASLGGAASWVFR